MTYNNRNYEWLYEQSIFAIQKAVVADFGGESAIQVN